MAEPYEEANFLEWWSKLSGDRRAIEGVINHVHLWAVFMGGEEDDGGELERLAEAVAECWAGVLKNRYPGRRFDVRVNSSPDDYGPTVSFSSVD